VVVRLTTEAIMLAAERAWRQHSKISVGRRAYHSDDNSGEPITPIKDLPYPEPWFLRWFRSRVADEVVAALIPDYRHQHLPSISLETIPEPMTWVEYDHLVDVHEALQDAFARLQALSPEDRHIFLTYLQADSSASAGAVLGLPADTVRKRMERIRKKLRE
jgi:DNA-directed RNA polymerase specialized sigma24 family protein